ncbi:MAG: 5'/3'-nucleotidase SurE [Anaerolineales bacterium]|nr:MAG: 5'/3'-nucleotidase SurE [Anaerolineales bacterium]
MENKDRPQILLTNDDGINSPGLWAAAEALSALGYVWVAAPREQSSGMGRSMPNSSDGIITTQTLTVHGNEWTIYAVGGTPAQVVQHAILEIMPPFKPDLVVAGVNYGTNFGTGVTISGTVGAALEGASYGAPALAVSLETEHKYHLTHSTEIDFKPAAYFTTYFAQKLLTRQFPEDMQVLKIEVPAKASIHTPWELTRLSRMRFYAATAPQRKSWAEPGSTGYAEPTDTSIFAPGTDVHATLIAGKVAVTPISLDLTARVDFAALEKSLREE